MPELQVAVIHWQMADQNVPMSDKIPTVVKHCLNKMP